MKWMREMAKSITVRLMVIFLAIWGLISALLMTALVVTERKMTETIMEGQKDRVSYYAAIVNADLRRITELMQQMCVDDDVSAFFRLRDQDFDYRDYQAYVNSYEKLKSYQATSMYIDDVFLVIPQAGELLRANFGVTSIPAGYEHFIEVCMNEKEEVFFAVEDTMVYLSRGITGTIVGLELSVRHIKTMLNALNPGYFDCFLVNRDTGELLGRNQVTEAGEMVYQATRDMPEGGYYAVETAGGRYLYDCVETPGNYFQLYLFAEEEKVYEDLYVMKDIWLLLTILMIAIPVIVGYLFHRTLSRPMRRLVAAMHAVENQIWNYRLDEDESSEFNYVFHQYNNMASRVEILIQQVYEKQLQVEQAKRRQLQAQINPHFLFNSFYMGYRMAKSGESEKVANLCMYLGDYFKVLTYASDHMICLGQEITFIDTYLRLNQMRFGDKLQYEICIREEEKNVMILPLLLQPLVENAIRHGVEHVQVPCCIRVEIKEKQNQLECSVTDDCGMTDELICERLQAMIAVSEIPSHSFGLWNVQKRLLSLGRSRSSGLRFERGEDGAFCVSFTLPKDLEE